MRLSQFIPWVLEVYFTCRCITVLGLALLKYNRVAVDGWWRFNFRSQYVTLKMQTLSIKNTGYTQKNSAVSKVNKKFISQLTQVQRNRQQRQLSKFRMLYQQFASHAYCGAAGPVSKMASQQEKAFVCSVLRCPDLWLQCSVSFLHGLEKTHHRGIT